MRILTLLSISTLVFAAQAQTTLFSEDFETSPAFTLNTPDASSGSGISNTWLINSTYIGGSGVADCLGFPLDFDISATPAQPAGITSQNGAYLHTSSLVAIQNGIQCCSFGAADGFCTDPDDIFARMSTDLSTVGQSDISLKFWWLCQGGNQNYGEVYFSINGGTSWLQVTTPISNYRNQPNWVEQTVTIPEFANQATLRFGFRFHNATSLLGAADPGFAIDDVRIIAAVAVPNSIGTNAISPTAYCQGASLSVPFTALGGYNAGNVFSAELSDAAGSFAAPVVIGTLNGTGSGTITCSIPALAPVGTGYRVRVVSSDPVTIGSINAVDISVTSAPFAGADDAVSICKNTGVYDLLEFLPGASVCGAWTGPSGASFSGQFNSATNNAGDYTYTTNCPGGCPQDAATITITLVNPANAGDDVSTSLCSDDPPASLIPFVDGGDLTGIFFYNGQPTTGALFANAGTYDLRYVVYATTPCVNDSASFVFTVNPAVDAGTSSSLTVCANAGPVQLIDALGGTPQGGGTWTGPSSEPVSGVLNPATDASGLYTYTLVAIEPCVDDQAFVAVVIDPCSGIAERTLGPVVEWRGQQGREHLFNLDGGPIDAIEVIDAAGRVVSRVGGPFATGLARIDLGHLSEGLHVVRLQSQDLSTLVRIVHHRY